MEPKKSENEFSRQPLKEKIKSFFKPEGIEKEMLRYRPNNISKNITLLALACVIAGFSTIYGYIKTVDWKTGMDIIGGILIMLFSFTASIEMSSYSKKWSYVIFGVAALTIIRIFIYPMQLVIPNSKGIQVLDNVRFTAVVILYVVAAILYVIAGVLTIYRGAALRAYLKEHKSIENEIIKEK